MTDIENSLPVQPIFGQQIQFENNQPIMEVVQPTVEVFGENDLKARFQRFHQVYCHGSLLHDVQMAHLFNDSKTFVDMKLRAPSDKVVERYAALRTETGDTGLMIDQLIAFVNDNFENGDELESWTPPDLKNEPSLMGRVSHPAFKQWVLDLNQVWASLARKVKDDVRDNPDLYSLIYVPNGFVIPGGRFRELYYWDTFWIINGLLLCDMADTARGVIENLIWLVRKYGFVPNGSRVYYLERTQPPLLMHMADSYYTATNDREFIRANIHHFETEFLYWEDNRSVKVRKNGMCYKLYRYYAPSLGPRPESYREDYLTAKYEETEDQKTELYVKIKSAAESGWDFSGRWFIKDGSNKGNLSNINTPSIVPVDLNCFIHRNAVLLALWFGEMGEKEKSRHYQRRADEILEAITAVLWRKDIGIWLDYDLHNRKSREYFYLSNFTPLWTQTYQESAEEITEHVLRYMRTNNIEQYLGGTPMSLDQTGEQWDFPNAWPPGQAIIIQGLDKLATVAAQEEAKRLADLWVKSNYKGWHEKHVMFEKYDVLLPGETGEGGEYVAQTGFGWTNGVVLEFLNRWGKELTPYPDTYLYPQTMQEVNAV